MITLTGTRPAAALTQPLTLTLDLQTPIYNDTDDTFLFPFALHNIAPNPANFTTTTNVTYNTTAPTLTTTGGGFANVRLGDRVESPAHPGDFVAQIVASKSADNNTITLNANPTAAAGSGAPLQFIPPVVDLALFYVRVTTTLSGSALTATVQLIPVPEGMAIDVDGDGDTVNDINVSTLTPERTVITSVIDLDSYLTAARVNR